MKRCLLIKLKNKAKIERIKKFWQGGQENQIKIKNTMHISSDK